MIEIQPKTEVQAEPLTTNKEAVGDGGDAVIEVPQELLEYFNIKPEDNLTNMEVQRLGSIYSHSKELFPTGDVSEIMRFVKAVEMANPVYAGSEVDRLFNMYKNFKLGKVYANN